MNDLRLKPGVKFAPAGHPFVDRRTGFKADAYERSISGAVEMIIQHRLANNRIYDPKEPQHFSPALVRQELFQQLNEKVPHIFAGDPPKAVERTDAGKPVACTCGSENIAPNYCKTCGSGKVQMGWACQTCGKIFSA